MLTRRDMNRIKGTQKELDLTKKIEELQKQVEELKANLARAKEDHQYDKIVHEKELKDLTKK